MTASDRHLLVLADTDSHRRVTAERILCQSYRVTAASSREDLERELAGGPVDVVLMDVDFLGAPMTEQITTLRSRTTAPEIIVLCDVDQISRGVSAVRAGASDFMLRGHEAEELEERIARALRRRPQDESELPSAVDSDIVVGQCAQMRKAFESLRRVAPLPVPVLFLGETGVGKEVFARLIHRLGARPRGPFVPINIAAIPAELLESTLFGHERGAFTGAVARNAGKLAHAHGGTLFLDEIGEMRVDLQSKLLRFIQEKEYEPVGGREPVRADVRLVTATNIDLSASIRSGGFRSDLFYRINAVTIRIPPLRDRIEDFDELLEVFLRRYAAAFGRSIRGPSPSAIRALHSYNWPGNVRELENRVQRAVALSDGPILGPDDFFDVDSLDPTSFVSEHACAPCTLANLEEDYIRQILVRTGNHYGEAARVLGIDRKTLYNKMIRYGMLTPKSDGDRSLGSENEAVGDLAHRI